MFRISDGYVRYYITNKMVKSQKKKVKKIMYDNINIDIFLKIQSHLCFKYSSYNETLKKGFLLLKLKTEFVLSCTQMTHDTLNDKKKGHGKMIYS